jgi:hypothetical protein
MELSCGICESAYKVIAYYDVFKEKLFALMRKGTKSIAFM